MKDNKKILAHNITYLRKKMGLNQDQLASELNIKRSNIAAYEAKNVEPRLRIILEMAKLFNVDLQLFLQNKLDDSTEVKAFRSTSSKTEFTSKFEIENQLHIDNFVQKSIQIKKILIGFKTFYAFRKSKITNLTPNKERILFDMDNFIMLMEHLLSYNENIIKAISSKRKDTNSNMT
jgi:transcriptional regulator with XRE-family HTH domain